MLASADERNIQYTGSMLPRYSSMGVLQLDLFNSCWDFPGFGIGLVVPCSPKIMWLQFGHIDIAIWP